MGFDPFLISCDCSWKVANFVWEMSFFVLIYSTVRRMMTQINKVIIVVKVGLNFL